MDFKDLVKTYVELENRLKALEEKADNKSSELNDFEKINMFINEIYSKGLKKNYITKKLMMVMMIEELIVMIIQI